MSARARNVDVLIVGGGLTGLALAVAIKQAVGDSLRVELWDRALRQRSPRQKVSAIAAGPRRMLERLGAWGGLADAQPIVSMDITDSKLEDAVRPLYLRFDGEAAPGEPFAHMVCNADLESALERLASDHGAILHSGTVSRTHGPSIVTAEGATIRARLVVAADGARSPMREAANIGCVNWSYPAKALVCTVEHERDHEGRARQHFLPEGPFAILPLAGRRSSIVWTAPSKTADWLADLSPESFQEELEKRFGLELGAVKAIDAPMRFDLAFSLARRLVAQRLALIGDAAHCVHPLAGQGLNLGLRDVAALAEIIVDAARLGLDPGASDPLRSYERMRRFDAFTMAFATDALNRMFLREGPFRLARDLGLGLTHRSPALKSMLIREAAGLSVSPPRLFLGQSL